MTGDHPLTNAEAPETVEIIQAETVFQGYFRIDRYTLRHRTHDGGWSGTMTREVFERGHATAIIPYDPWRDRVLLIEQFRAPALAAAKSAWQMEVVAGVIDKGQGPETVAHREMKEETGETLHDLIPLYHYLVSQGGTSETVRLYCGIVDTTAAGGIHGLDEEQEDIRVHVLAFDEAWARVKDGRIDNAPTIIGLQWLALERGNLPTAYTR